jgi:ectoine hydroxylase-related dioxygenase (phytanoyl-CoA dioxygenase family)
MNDIESKVQQFHKDGYLVLPGILPADDVARLRAGLEDAFDRPSEESTSYNMPEMWRPKMFEHGEPFEKLVDHPATIDLVEAILGDNCHLIAMSALRTLPDNGIDSWHADETVRFPIPRGVQLDERIQVPCFIVNLNYYLCDVDEEVGPTQFVPGSHRSGRQPEDEDRDKDGNPFFEDQGMVSALGPAGTCVMWHDQTWHRGAKNLSRDRVRWVQQAPYGRRFISQRFYPFIKYRMPEEILERANPRRQRLLGMHSRGAYG